MQTPEEFAREVLTLVGDGDEYVSPHALLDLIRARDAEVRADERAKALAGFTDTSPWPTTLPGGPA